MQPYQVGYYRHFCQRTIDLIRAQYSPDLAQVQNLLRTYGVDFWLLDRAAFTTSTWLIIWMRQYQPASRGAVNLEQGTIQPYQG